MPASIVPKSEPGTAGNTTSNTSDSTSMSSALSNRVLQIDSTKPADKLERVLVSLHGTVVERPYWHYFAHHYPDRRDRRPLTLQYTCEGADGLFTDQPRQESVRAALWSALKDILSAESLTEVPKITFDEYESPKSKTANQVINLTFCSYEAFECVEKSLQELDIGGGGNQRRLYAVTPDPNGLAGSIFIFDCMNIPLDSVGVEALLSALTDMTKDFGSLVGMAKIIVESSDGDFTSELDTVRGYVQLAGPWIAAPLQELATRFPSHFVWRGNPYKLLYVGYDLHKKPHHSADYPLSSLASGGPASSAAASKKRKANEE